MSSLETRVPGVYAIGLTGGISKCICHPIMKPTLAIIEQTCMVLGINGTQ